MRSASAGHTGWAGGDKSRIAGLPPAARSLALVLRHIQLLALSVRLPSELDTR
jgi:hypothetical protein